MTPKQFVAAFNRVGSIKGVARDLGTSYHAAHSAYEQAVIEQMIEPIRPGRKTVDHLKDAASGKLAKAPKKTGRVRALQARKIAPLPEAGKVNRFIFTCAQNNTKLHEGVWTNLQALAKHYDARLCVSRFAYIKQGLGARGDKAAWMNGGGKSANIERFRGVRDLHWDERLDPFLVDDRMEVAPGLVFCGEMNILPTVQAPLSGFETYTGRRSMIMPHVKIAMESIATMQEHPTKFNYTTGAITLRNYIQRAAGLKAEFHHCYGGLLVEVDSNGNWWCRQLNADSTGTIYDLTWRVKDGVVEKTEDVLGYSVEDYGSGDVHVINVDPTVVKAKWAEGGVIDILKPRTQCIHDILDFYSRSHHTIDNPHKMFLRHINGQESVEQEVVGVGGFLLNKIARPFCDTIVVNSNHDRHPSRWLQERNGLKDPVNAPFWLGCQNAIYQSMVSGEHSPDTLVTMLHVAGFHDATFKQKRVTFLPEDMSFVICPLSGGGIEGGMHGDRGSNGARGSAKNIAKMGRRANIFHSHSACIRDGVYQGGTSSKLRLEYVHGPSSHSHSDIVTYPNGKRAILTMWDRRYWAEQPVEEAA